MKNLIFITLLVIATIQVNAQSLAQRVNEQRSLSRAVCTLYNLDAYELGNDKIRVYMQKYAKSIGLNYELYEFNGGNNLYILHYVADSNTIESSNTNDTELTSVDACSNCGHNAQDRTEGVDANAEASNYFQDELMNKAQDETPMSTVDVIDTIVKVDTVVLTNIVTVTEVKVDTIVKVEEIKYCDCTDLTLDQAWDKHNMLKEEWKNDRKENNQYINSQCRAKLRRYIHTLQQEEYDITRIERWESRDNDVKDTEDKLNIPMVGVISIGFNDEPEVKKVSRKRRVRKLGKGHSRGKSGRGFKLFPYANC